jgi:hypothetical protein
LESTAPAQEDEYGEPDTGLELVAVVEHVGFVERDEDESLLTKPE